MIRITMKFISFVNPNRHYLKNSLGLENSWKINRIIKKLCPIIFIDYINFTILRYCARIKQESSMIFVFLTLNSKIRHNFPPKMEPGRNQNKDKLFVQQTSQMNSIICSTIPNYNQHSAMSKNYMFLQESTTVKFNVRSSVVK